MNSQKNKDTKAGQAFSLIFVTLLFSVFSCAIFTGIPLFISHYWGWFNFGQESCLITGAVAITLSFLAARYVLKNNL
jgi:ABC-type uncharacterized transport system permease subunit